MVVVDENIDPLVSPTPLQRSEVRSKVIILQNLIVANDGRNIIDDITFSEDNNTEALETPLINILFYDIIQGSNIKYIFIALTKEGAVRKRKSKTSAEDKTQAKRQQVLLDRYVRPGCGALCKISCIKKINQERRVVLNEHFWRMDWALQKSFILSHCGNSDVKRRTIKMCTTFFLTILGYNKKNDGVVFGVFNTTSHQSIIPSIDRRGHHPSTKKFVKPQIVSHIEPFHPTASHYRREHAPNVRYLPSDTIAFMHQDFLQKYPIANLSYDLYRKVLNETNVHFTKLVHEQCET
nr:unnamed protein product [Callosobruchus analis]